MISLDRLLRPFRTSLRYRLALSIALVHAVMMAIFVFDLTGREHDLLLQQTEQKALTSAALLARSSHEWVLSNDLAGLGELLKPVNKSEDMEFAIIANRDGRILAHTQADKVGLYLNDIISTQLIENPPAKPRLVQQTRTLIDAIAPIERAGNTIGWVRVGMNNASTHAAMHTAVRDGLLYALGAILLGSLLALMIASDLTGDLRRIQGLFRRVGKGSLDQRISINREDELGSLMHSLNGMLDHLETDEQLLKQTRERLELALKGSNDGLWDWDLTSNHVFFSPRWKSMLGHTDEEVGNTLEEWSTRVHTDDMPRTLEDIQAHLRGETQAYENIHRMRHKDGSWRWILDRGIAMRDEHGDAYRMVGTHTDITHRIELEQRLSEQKERLHIVLMSMADGVIVTNSAGKIEFINPAAEVLTGWSLAEAIGQPLDRVAKLVTEDQDQPISAALLHTKAQEGNHELTARLLHRGDSDFHMDIELNVSPIRGDAESDGLVFDPARCQRNPSPDGADELAGQPRPAHRPAQSPCFQ